MSNEDRQPHDWIISSHEDRFSRIEQQMRENHRTADEANGRSKSNTARLNNFDRLVEVMHETNINVKVMGEQMSNLIKTNETIITKQVEHDMEISQLKTKGAVTVAKVAKWIVTTVVAFFIAMLFGIWQASLIASYLPD